MFVVIYLDMVVSCCVAGCRRRSGDKPRFGNKLSFHRIPRPGKLREKWLNALRHPAVGGKAWNPPKQDCLCSDHFTEHDFMPYSGKTRYLREGSIPTRFNIHRVKRTTYSRDIGPCPTIKQEVPLPPTEEPCAPGTRPLLPIKEEPLSRPVTPSDESMAVEAPTNHSDTDPLLTIKEEDVTHVLSPRDEPIADDVEVPPTNQSDACLLPPAQAVSHGGSRHLCILPRPTTPNVAAIRRPLHTTKFMAALKAYNASLRTYTRKAPRANHTDARPLLSKDGPDARLLPPSDEPMAVEVPPTSHSDTGSLPSISQEPDIRPAPARREAPVIFVITRSSHTAMPMAVEVLATEHSYSRALEKHGARPSPTEKHSAHPPPPTDDPVAVEVPTTDEAIAVEVPTTEHSYTRRRSPTEDEHDDRPPTATDERTAVEVPDTDINRPLRMDHSYTRSPTPTDEAIAVEVPPSEHSHTRLLPPAEGEPDARPPSPEEEPMAVEVPPSEHSYTRQPPPTEGEHNDRPPTATDEAKAVEVPDPDTIRPLRMDHSYSYTCSTPSCSHMEGKPTDRPPQKPGARPSQVPGARPSQVPGHRPSQVPGHRPPQEKEPGARPSQEGELGARPSQEGELGDRSPQEPGACPSPTKAVPCARVPCTLAKRLAVRVRKLRYERKLLRQKLKRREGRIKDLKKALGLEKEKNRLSEKDQKKKMGTIFVNETVAMLFQNELTNGTKKGGRRFSEDVVKFCQNLYDCSPRAYNFVAENFTLPAAGYLCRISSGRSKRQRTKRALQPQTHCVSGPPCASAPVAHIDSCASEPVAHIDSCASEPEAHIDWCAMEPEVLIDSCASEPEAHIDSCASEPEAHIDSCASEPEAHTNSCASEPEAHVDSCASEPEAHIDSCASEPEAHIDSCASEPETHIDSCASEPEDVLLTYAVGEDGLLTEVHDQL